MMKSVTKKWWAMAACFASSFLFLMFQGGRLAFMLFMMVTLLTLYVALGFKIGLRGASGVREIDSGRHGLLLEAHHPLTVRLRLRIPGIWPIPYIIVRDRLVRGSGETQVFEHALVLNWKREGTMEYTIPQLRRGHYRFSETSFFTTDIFGWFEYESTLALPTAFAVLPQKVSISQWKMERRHSRGLQPRSFRVFSPRETTQIDGVREYQYGDRLSRIHWNATARTGTWKSKEFERETLTKTVIVFVRNPRLYQNGEQFELAVSTVASLLDYGQKNGLSFGLWSVGRETVCFDPKNTAEHYERMMRHLIDVEAEEGPPLEKVLKERLSHSREGRYYALVCPMREKSAAKAAEFLVRTGAPCSLFDILPRTETTPQGDADMVWRRMGCPRYAVRKLHELPDLLGGQS